MEVLVVPDTNGLEKPNPTKYTARGEKTGGEGGYCTSLIDVTLLANNARPLSTIDQEYQNREGAGRGIVIPVFNTVQRFRPLSIYRQMVQVLVMFVSSFSLQYPSLSGYCGENYGMYCTRFARAQRRQGQYGYHHRATAVSANEQLQQRPKKNM